MSLDPLDILMGDDDLDDSDVSGEDPFVGATLRGLSLRNRQPSASLDTTKLKEALSSFRRRVNVQRVARIDTLSKTEKLPATYLGVDSVANILAGANFNVVFQSVSPVRLINLTVAAAVGPVFLINAIFVGRTNLLMSAVGVPADRFLPDSARPPMESPILPAATQGIINVTNIGGAPARFIASFDVIDLLRENPDCSR